MVFMWVPFTLKFKIRMFSKLPKELPYSKRFCANFEMELLCER